LLYLDGMARIVSAGIAVPPYCYQQSAIRAEAQRHFTAELQEADRLISVFDSVQVQKRHFCVPLEWFSVHHSFTEKNNEYVRWAEQLSLQAIQACLEKTSLGPGDIDHLVFVSTSGMATPSVDARLMNRMGFRAHMRRTPLFGLGCAGGAAGLSLCSRLAKADPGGRILLVAVEISSLTFQPGDFSKSNLVASALFADGAAAVLVCGDRCDQPGVSIQESLSTLWPDTLEIMGWTFGESGLGVIFSKSIPSILAKYVHPNLLELLRPQKISIADLTCFAVHPGGAKVLSAISTALDIDPDLLEKSRSILESYGNMSSPTVLFILQKMLEENPPAPGSYGLCAAFGPGFSSELLLLRW
jgi:alkylresorcinol/alkylpyrone synthase